MYLYGTGQGAGWSSPSWTVFSDIISRVMEQYTLRIKITAPNCSYVDRIMDTFVDNANWGLTKNAWIDFHPEKGDAIQKHTNIYEHWFVLK